MVEGGRLIITLWCEGGIFQHYLYVYTCFLFVIFCRCTKCENEDDLRTYMKSKLGMFKDTFGVVLYLYSIVLTKVCYIIIVELFFHISNIKNKSLVSEQ